MVDKKDVKIMHVYKVMSTSLVTASENASILDICSMLTDSNVGSTVIIGDEGKPIGIVTKRDIVKFIASEPSSLEISVREVMTTPVITIGPSELLTTAIMRMYLKGVKKLVVVDDSENLIGVITQTDILRNLKSDLFKPQF